MFTVKAKLNGHERSNYHWNFATLEGAKHYINDLMKCDDIDTLLVIQWGRGPGDDKVIQLWHRTLEVWKEI